MYSIDKTNFKSFLLEFPEQIEKSFTIFKEAHVKIDVKKIENIIYLGMGGSAISGDILKGALYDRLKLPVTVVRGYHVPAYCNDKTLVIACSYSGNTEETVNAVKSAHLKNAKIVCITTGGELAELARENDWSIITIPGGLPPRQSFGYLFFCTIHILNYLNVLDVSEKEIKNIINLIRREILQFDDKTADGTVLPKELARKIQDKIPLIYSTSPYFSAISTRWQNQFQENSKSMAFANVIPEMNHNEIVGWEMHNRCLNNFIVIFLEFNAENDRIAERIKLTKKIIKDKNIPRAEIFAQGNTTLENAISFIILADWISYYLALFYEKNPLSILNIDYLKNELNKLK